MSRRLLQFLVDLMKPDFYGDIHIRVEAGQPVKIDVLRNYRVDKLPPARATVTVSPGAAVM